MGVIRRDADIMGLMDFARGVGKRLGLGKGKDDDARAIKKELKDLGLDRDDVAVDVDGDRVVIKGEVSDQETLEKIILATGNAEGVSTVDNQMTARKASAPARFHTVERGDTLWAISKKAYGNGAKYMTIFEANRPMLKDPDRIYPGQVLRIPEL